MNTNTILVIGSTGKTGKRVATRLTDLGIDVRHGSRSSATPFDWDQPSTWAPALHGVTAAYVTYSPDLAVPGSVDAITELVTLARAAGVRRLVLLSGRGEEEAERAEDVVRDSGLEWSIVRATWFAQNFSEGNFADDVAAGTVALPVGDVLEPFVDADDIADVAVAALTDDRHVGQTYELTGPRLLTFADAVSEIATATGRELRFESVSMDDYAATLDGIPSATGCHLPVGVSVHHRARRTKRYAGRRGATRARTPAARLRRLRPPGCRDRHVDALARQAMA